MEVSSIADTLAAMARQGGGTLDLSTGAAATRESGYYVGGAHGIAAARFNMAPTSPKQWKECVERILNNVPECAYVGVWEHAAMYYVDATDWHATEWDALEAGRARGEIAVWDIAKECEITC